MSRVNTSGGMEKAVEVLHNIGKATQGADVLDPKYLATVLQIVNIYYNRFPQPSCLLVPLAHCAGNLLCTTKNEDSVRPHAEMICSVLVHCLRAVETASREVAEEEMTKSEIIRNLTDEYKTMLNNNPRTRYFLLGRLFQPLANLINSYRLSAAEVSDVAKLLNRMMAGVRRNVRSEIFKRNEKVVEAFINRMITCGDYEAQQDILEILVRLSSEEKEYAAREWFDQPILIAAFLDIGTKQFELECRSFLNLLNSVVGDNCSVFTFPCETIRIGNVKVHKPKSDIVKELFLDCNMGSKSLSFSFVRSPGQLDLENNQFFNVNCPASLTHTAYLLGVDEKFLQLTLTLETVIPGLDDTDLAKYRSCTMVFKRKHSDLPMILYSIFGNILQCDPEVQMAIQQQISRSNHHGKFRKASDGVILRNTHISDEVDYIELSSDEEIQSKDLESANCHEASKARAPPPLLSRDPADCNVHDVSDQDDSNVEEDAISKQNKKNVKTTVSLVTAALKKAEKPVEESSHLEKTDQPKSEPDKVKTKTAITKQNKKNVDAKTTTKTTEPKETKKPVEELSHLEKPDAMKDVKSADNTKKTNDFSSIVQEKKVETIPPEDILMLPQTAPSPIILTRRSRMLRKKMGLASPQNTSLSQSSSAASTLVYILLGSDEKLVKQVAKTRGASNEKLQSKEEPVVQENVDVKTTASLVAATPKKGEKSAMELRRSEKIDQPSSEPDKVKTKSAISKQNKNDAKITEDFATASTATPKKAEKPVTDLSHLEKTDQPSSEPDKVKTKTAISKQNKRNVDVKTTDSLVTAKPKQVEEPVEELSHSEKTDQQGSEPDKVKNKTTISIHNKKNIKTTESLVTAMLKTAEKPVKELSHLEKTDQPKSEPDKLRTKTAITKQNKKNVDAKTKTTEPKETEKPVGESPHLEKAGQPSSEPYKVKTKTAISKQNKKNVDAKTTTKTTEPKETEKPVEESPHLEKAGQPSSEPDKVKTKTAISKQNKKNVDAKTTTKTTEPKETEKPVEESSHLEKADQPTSEPDKLKTKASISKQNKKNVDVKTTDSLVTVNPKQAEKYVEELSHLEITTDQPSSEPEKVKTKTAISKQNKINVDAKITELKEAEKPVEELSHLEKIDQPNSEPEKIQNKTAFSKRNNISPAVMPCKTSRVEESANNSSALVPLCKTIQTTTSPLEAEPAIYTEETSNHSLKVAELPDAASSNPSLFEDLVPSKMRLRRRTKNKQKQLQLPHLQFIGDKNSSITPAGSRKRKLFTPGNKLSDSPMPECAKKSRNETKESPTFVKQMNENICTMQINQSMTVKSSLQIAINFSKDTEDYNYSAAHTVFSDTEEFERQDDIVEWSKQKAYKSYDKNVTASKKREKAKSIQNNCDSTAVANSKPINFSKDAEDYNYSAHTVFSDTKELDKQDDIAEWLKPKTFKSYGKNVAASKKTETVKSIKKNCDTPPAANNMDCKQTLNVVASCNQETIDTTSIGVTTATKVDEKTNNCKNVRQKQNKGGKNVKRQQKRTTKNSNKLTTAQMCSDTNKHETIQSLYNLWSDDYLESLPELVVEKPEEPQPLVKPATPKFLKLKLKPMCYDPVATNSKTSNYKSEAKKRIQFDQDNFEASKDESMLYADSASDPSSPSIIPDSQHQPETWDDLTSGRNENKLKNTKRPKDVAPEPQHKSDVNRHERMRGGGNNTVQSSQDSIWGIPSKVYTKRNQPISKKTEARVLNSEKSEPINPKISEKSTNSVTEKKSIPANVSVEVMNDKKKNASKSKPVSLSLAKTKKTIARGKKNTAASCSELFDEEFRPENSDHALFSDFQRKKVKKSAQNGKTENKKVSNNSKQEPAMEGHKTAVDKTGKNLKNESAMDKGNTKSIKAVKPSKQESAKKGYKTEVQKTSKNSKKESVKDRNKTTVDKVKEKKDLCQPMGTTKPSTKVVVDQAKEEQLKSFPVKPAAVKATKKTIKAKEKCNSPTIKAKAKPTSRSTKKQEAVVNSQVVSKPTSTSKTRKKIAIKPIDELEYTSSIEEVFKESETTEKLTYCEDIKLASKSGNKKLKLPPPTKISKKAPVKQQKANDTKIMKPSKEIKEDSELDCFTINTSKYNKQMKEVKQVSEKQMKTAEKRKAEPLSSSKSKVAVAKDSYVQKKYTSLKMIPESSSVETSPSIIEGTPPESTSFVETHVPKTRDQAKYHASRRLNIGKLSHSVIAEELAQTTPVSSPESSPVRSERNTNVSEIAASPAFHSTPKKKKLRRRYPMTSESEEVETPPMVRRKLRCRSLLPSLSAAKKTRQQKLSEHNPSTSSEDDSATEEPPAKRPALEYLKSSSKDRDGESEDNLQAALETSSTFNNSVMNSGRYFQNVIQLAEKCAEKMVKESFAARQENLKHILRKLEEELEKCEERRAKLEAVEKRQEKMLHYAYNTFVLLHGIMDTPPASLVSKRVQQERPEVNLTERLEYDLNKLGEDYQRRELRSTMMGMQSKLHFLLL